MSAGLIAFLRARLDEDEQTARAAAGVCGCHDPAARWTFDDDENDGRIVIVDDPHPEMKRKVERRWNGSYDGLFAARHIARHDPARVLAEIDAKRQIVERHGPAILHGGGGAQYYNTTRVCRSCEPPKQFPEQAWPCPTLRLLALPYADHPDYRAEWRP